MNNLVMLTACVLAAFLVAWVVNALVGLLSGEKPGDTGRLWLDVFSRIVPLLELGIIGWVLNHLGLKGWRRKLVLFIGVLCILSLLVRACRDTHDDQLPTHEVQAP
jgi:hypothetical protein